MTDEESNVRRVEISMYSRVLRVRTPKKHRFGEVGESSKNDRIDHLPRYFSKVIIFQPVCFPFRPKPFVFFLRFFFRVKNFPGYRQWQWV